MLLPIFSEQIRLHEVELGQIYVPLVHHLKQVSQITSDSIHLLLHQTTTLLFYWTFIVMRHGIVFFFLRIRQRSYLVDSIIAWI